MWPTFQSKTILTPPSTWVSLSPWLPGRTWPGAWLSFSLSSCTSGARGYSRLLFFWLLILCWWVDLFPSLQAHLCTPRRSFSHMVSCLHGYPTGTSNFSPTSVLLLHLVDFPHHPFPPACWGPPPSLTWTSPFWLVFLLLLILVPVHSPLCIKNTFPKWR